MIEVRTNLKRFNESLKLYAEASRKTPEEVLTKQGGKLAWSLRRELRDTTPPKGEIRAERLAALAGGEGVRIRPSIRRQVMERVGARSEISSHNVVFTRRGVRSVMRKGRRLNLQALMVSRELASRESARGFLSISSKYPPKFPKMLSGKNELRALSRYGPILSEAGLNRTRDTLTFSWSAGKSFLSGEAAGGLQRPKAIAAIARALHLVRDDILEYVIRKLKENKRRANLN